MLIQYSGNDGSIRMDKFLPHNTNKQKKYILNTDLMEIQIISAIAAINSIWSFYRSTWGTSSVHFIN